MMGIAEMQVDMRVKFMQDWELAFPHFKIKKGEKGTVIQITDELVAIRMDNIIDGAEEWDNCVHLYREYLKDGFDFTEYIEVIDEKEAYELKKQKDEWYEKYGLIETPVDFEFHLDEDCVKDETKIIDSVRIVKMEQINVEFGFEDKNNYNGNAQIEKRKVKINFGFGEVVVDKSIFEEALKHYRLNTTVGKDELEKRIKVEKEVKNE